MVVPSSDRDRNDTDRQGNLHGRRGSRDGAIAELAVGAETPRIQHTVGSDDETVVSAPRTGGRRHTPREGVHCWDVGVSRRADSQCPVRVVAKDVEGFCARSAGRGCVQGGHGQWRRHDQHGQRRAHEALSPQAARSPHGIVPGTTHPVRHRVASPAPRNRSPRSSSRRPQRHVNAFAGFRCGFAAAR